MRIKIYFVNFFGSDRSPRNADMSSVLELKILFYSRLSPILIGTTG